jgi:hypothetical protein
MCGNSKAYKLSFKRQAWPFIPGREEWSLVPFAEARSRWGQVTFVGHDSRNFYFQVRGINEQYSIPMDKEALRAAGVEV